MSAEIFLTNDQNSEYIIQTCFNFRTEYIFISTLDVNSYIAACKLSIHSDASKTSLYMECICDLIYILSGGQRFSINLKDKQKVYLYNQNYAEIAGNRFHQIVSLYWRDASFCVNLVTEPIKTQTADITPKVRKNSHFIILHSTKYVYTVF